MSSLTVASSLQDRKLYSTSVVAQHLSRDPQYGTRASLKFRVANRTPNSRSESQTIEFNLDREDAVKLYAQLGAFLAIRQEPVQTHSVGAHNGLGYDPSLIEDHPTTGDKNAAISLVLALHDNPKANPPGYLVKLDPMAEQQLRAALA